jgi:glycosyltransferase involved in cell wall biosynthesis
MNIVYHHRTQGTGAEGVHIGHVIKGLRDIGHSVVTVSPNNEDPTKTGGDNPYEKKQSLKARLFHFLSRSLPQVLFEVLEILYNFTANSKLNTAAKKGKIDFLYERNAFFLFAGARFSKRHNIPFIVEVNEIVGEHRVRDQFFVKLAKRIETSVFEQADAIIVVSTFLKQKIAQIGVPEDKIHVIPNAADNALFNPDKYSKEKRSLYKIDDNDIVLGFIGWFVAWHNFDLLIQALSELNKTRTVHLMLVGDGVLKEQIAAKARSLDCEDKLIFTGAIKHAEIPAFVQAMDICIIPGSNAYRSPIKLFEYMAMGKPTVAPALEPIEYVTKHKSNAMHFTPDDPQSLVNAIKILAESDTLRAEIGSKARNTIQTHHLWIHNSQKVIDIFENCK